ncbi:MAG: hypothetical protein QXY07_04510 [Candidatus Bathyarchaeia archaeon]
MSVLSAERVRRLSLGVNSVDDVFPGFESGDFGVLCGSDASAFGFALCVRCVMPAGMGGLGSEVVFVDGGNSFNPYFVADIARGFGLDPRFVLERIHVSRAFTAYQLSALILEKLNGFLNRRDVGLVYVSEISKLFLDRDIPKTEAQDLFVRVCAALADIASKRGKIVLATYTPDRSSRRGVFFEAALFGRSNVLVRIDRRGKILRFSMLDHPRLKPFSLDVPLENFLLTDFMGV